MIGPHEFEQWRPCQGYPQHQVSSLGAVRHARTHRPLKGSVTDRGYRQVQLRRSGPGCRPYVHQLVAVAFHGPSALTVDHLNHDKLDNRASNLRWLSLELNSVRWWHARDSQGRNVWATVDTPMGADEGVEPLTAAELAEVTAAWAS